MPFEILRDNRGNMALLGAAAMAPLMFGVGLAVDYTTITRTRSVMQNAVDSAALAVAQAGPDLPEDEALAMAAKYLGANYGGGSGIPQLTRNANGVTIKVDTEAKLAFGGLMGYDEWPVLTSATASTAYLNYEIGLVLDTTGSMAGGKLASLKDAVTGFIDTTAAAVPADQLKMAMVPFASFVNVGPQYGPTFDKKGRVDKKSGADWLDVEGKVKLPQVELQEGVSRFELYRNLKVEWPGCVETRVPVKGNDYDVLDIVATRKKTESLFVPTFAIDEGDAPGLYANSYLESSVDPLDMSTMGKGKKLKKYGVPVSILGVIDTLLDLLPVDVGGITERKGPNSGCNSQPITPLTDDTNALKTRVQQLKADGNTNIMEGVMWGWRVLSPGAPFSEGKPASNAVQKIMVVLTDGKNTMGIQKNPLGSLYSSFGYMVDGRLGPTSPMGGTTPEDLMNAKTSAACENAKAEGIEIFTIRLEEPDVATGSMLKDCASGADHYLDVPSRSQLDEAFKSIRRKMVKLRLSS